MYCTSSRSTSSRRISGLSKRAEDVAEQAEQLRRRHEEAADRAERLGELLRRAHRLRLEVGVGDLVEQAEVGDERAEALHLVGPHVARPQEHPAAVVEGVELDDQRAQLGLACRHPQPAVAEPVADAVAGLAGRRRRRSP